jgi:hypothetical protein
MTGEYLSQGALAGSVGTHHGVNFSSLYGEIDAFQDFLVADVRVQVLYF